MTDHPDPTALRLEGQRLVEAATRDWALSIADPISRIPPGDRSMRENALVDLAQATRTLLTTLAALTEERDALIRDKEEAQSLLEWPFASVRELANETGRLRMNEHALTEERDRLRARLAKHEGVDTGDWFYPDGDTSSDACCDTPEEVLTERYEAQHNPSAVYVIERAIKLPDIFAAVRVFTEEEKDKRADDEDCAITYHTSREEAEATLTARPTP